MVYWTAGCVRTFWRAHLILLLWLDLRSAIAHFETPTSRTFISFSADVACAVLPVRVPHKGACLNAFPCRFLIPFTPYCRSRVLLNALHLFSPSFSSAAPRLLRVLKTVYTAGSAAPLVLPAIPATPCCLLFCSRSSITATRPLPREPLRILPRALVFCVVCRFGRFTCVCNSARLRIQTPFTGRYTIFTAAPARTVDVARSTVQLPYPPLSVAVLLYSVPPELGGYCFAYFWDVARLPLPARGRVGKYTHTP